MREFARSVIIMAIALAVVLGGMVGAMSLYEWLDGRYSKAHKGVATDETIKWRHN